MTLVGRELAHFQILEKIGEGGMGAVYKARDTHLDRIVALKILPPNKAGDPERQRRFAQEAKAASGLNHPGIVAIYDVDSSDGVYFIAMEYIEGKTLDRLIARKGLSVHAALSYAVQIADALSRAHNAGIVHRDLKPANIMITSDSVVKVLDFGLAKLAEPASGEDATTLTAGHTVLPITEEGKIVGTFAYMSPEQAQGKAVDARSDIFSFGSVLFEMVTGRRAFAGETALATLAAVLNEETPPLGAAADLLPPDLERVVMRCLRKDPQRRWQTMADLKVALLDLKEESDSGKLSKGTTLGPERTTPMWIFAWATLALVIVAGAVAWWLQRKPAELHAFETERLTFESGLAGFPSISPDGKLLAYSSDRDGPLNLYVQQIGGRQSIRLTNQKTHDWLPDFSPDGSKIVFRSDRDGGGIYVIDALGGPTQKIAGPGYFPRYSLDGSTIAFVTSPLMGKAKLYLVPAKGGAPRLFQAAFDLASLTGYSPPVWSPDGQSILFYGSREGDSKSWDWWVGPVSGGEPVRVTAPALGQHAVMRRTFAWRGDYLYYLEGTTQGGMSIYRVPVSGPSWKVNGDPERITSPLAAQTGGSLSKDGRLVFTSWTVGLNVWSLPLDASHRAAYNQRRPVTSDSNIKWALTGAANGSRLAYMTATAMERAIEIRVRDNRSGHEDVITTSGRYVDSRPRLSGDGSQLAWSDEMEGKFVPLISDPSSGTAPPHCESCTILDLFPSGRESLVLHGEELVRLNTTTGEQRAVADFNGLAFSDAALSLDGHWLAFTAVRPDGTAAIFLILAGQQPSPRDTWIRIAEDRNYLSRPIWSADGRSIYYGSTRDNFWCIWVQRITTGGQPDGAPAAALHLHGFKQSDFLGGIYFAVSPEILYVLLAEMKGNVWMVKVDR